MDKHAAQTMIQDTLERSFDKGRFFYFLKNMLNHVEENSSAIYRGNHLPEAYQPSINSLERLGKYNDEEDNEIDLLVVQLKKDASLERARTLQRNFASWHLKGGTGGNLKDAALTAYVSPNQKDWRFSFVKMDYKFVQSENGRTRVKEEFTPARRYSFLVGENENSHTAKSQLLPLLENDEKKPTLGEIEDKFNIETVTKEFFERYRDLFLRTTESLDKIVESDRKIKEDFLKKNVNTLDFSKKLLGQVVFLYFLQKKGWFGVERDANWGTGSRNFIRNLFDQKNITYKNFFNDILEPLFYEALANERPGDLYAYLNCKIPFLNGGLFDPIGNYDWGHTDILLPNDLFSNKKQTPQGDVGTGILDIFDRYNFTVKEDEPLEKEVAVDPEMLGKVFENLLAVKDRKSKGTYYTPREIVHYMCQESLVHYLENELKKKVSKEDIKTLTRFGGTIVEHDSRVAKLKKETERYSYKFPNIVIQNARALDKALANIRICDPAVGSGAFLLGMMSEIVRIRNALTSYLDGSSGRTSYDFKRHAIHSCLYGVDIDPSADEICKLRLWLSLVVDEDDISQIKPLPNLDYKIVQGNSLLGVEKDLYNLKLFKELEELKPKYFNELNVKRKQKFKDKIDSLIDQITKGKKDFDFEVYFSEIFHEGNGFDVMIANPPYVVQQLNETKNFSWTKGNKNTYVAFLEIANKYIKKKGLISYIIPSTWLAGNNFKALREEILNGERIQQIVQLPYDIFEAAYVDNVILILTGKAVDNPKVKTFKFDIRDSVRTENIIFQEFLFEDWLSAPDAVIFLNQSLLQILKKYQSTPSKLLGEIAKVQRGTLPPKENELFDSNEIDQKKDLIRWFTGQVYRYVVIPGPKRFVIHQKLRENKPLEVFQGKKILGRQLISRQFRLQFAFAEGKFAFKKNLYAIYQLSKEFSYFYLIAILNSKLFSHIQVNLNASGQRDDFPALSLKDYRNFKIPNISLEDQKPFINLAREVLSITKEEGYLENSKRQSMVKELEKQIDRLVYGLYALTSEEIKLVEKEA